MVDYESIQRRRNLIVGAFVVIGTASFLWLIFAFGEMPTAVSRLRSYNIFVNFDTAPGVQQDTPIHYCGYQVGRVANIHPPEVKQGPDGSFYHQVTVELLIDNKFKSIPDNVTFNLIRRGFGSSFIDIRVDKSRESAGFIKAGGHYWGKTASSHEFIPEYIQKKIVVLADDLSELAQSANQILGDEQNQHNIKLTLANLADVTEKAKQTFESVKTFANQGALTLENTDSNITQVSKEFAATAKDLRLAIEDIRVTLEKVNYGDGTFSSLLNDGNLYENLVESSRELEITLKEIQRFAEEARENGVKMKW